MNYKVMLSVAVSVSLLIVALSIGYYFAVFLPKKEIQLIDIQRQEQVRKSQQEQATKDATTQKAQNLQACLWRAESNGSNYWNDMCKNFGSDTKKDNCLLPQHYADTVNQTVKDAKDVCFKQYPQ